MDRFAVETFLYSADFGDENYLYASSSSSSSDEECCCNAPPKNKIATPQGYMELVVPNLEDSEFKRNFRVTKQTAEKVAELIGEELFSNYEGQLQKINKSKVAYVFLWYLGSRQTLEQISERFKMTTCCLEAIISIGAKRISSREDEYICWPPRKDCLTLTRRYLELANMDGIIASLDVSYIQILEPSQDANEYYNPQNLCSLAVQGTVTPDYKFIDIYVGKGGSSYENILNKSRIVEKREVGHVLVCDHNYPIKSYLQPPYVRRHLTSKQVYFNKCHTFALSFVPRTFGYMKKRFLRLQKVENNDPELLSMLIKSAAVIHNICIDSGDSCDFFDNESQTLGQEKLKR